MFALIDDLVSALTEWLDELFRVADAIPQHRRNGVARHEITASNARELTESDGTED